MGEPSNLGSFPYRRAVVTCAWCPRRRGDYDTERLIARLGAGTSLETTRCASSSPAARGRSHRASGGANLYRPRCRMRFEDPAKGLPPNCV